MWALVIELAHEIIEARLLLETIEAWRACGFLLQGEVHALVAAVLLRPAGLDAFDSNAEAQPPHRQLGQIEQRIWTGEGNTVIGADRQRQAALTKQPFEGREGDLLANRFQRLAEKQEARGVVGDGEWVAITTVTELELALEIGAQRSLAAESSDSGVPRARWRGPPLRLTRPWRSRTAWMVLLAGTRIPPESLRTRSSRTLRAPQCGFSAFRRTMRLSTCCGS
jgi:hypothetical protein